MTLRQSLVLGALMATIAAPLAAQEVLRGGNALGAGGAKRATTEARPTSEAPQTQALEMVLESTDRTPPGEAFPTDGTLSAQMEAIRELRAAALQRAATMNALISEVDALANSRARALRDADAPLSAAELLYEDLGRRPQLLTPYEVTKAAVQAVSPLDDDPEKGFTGEDLRRAVLQQEARALFYAHRPQGGGTAVQDEAQSSAVPGALDVIGAAAEVAGALPGDAEEVEATGVKPIAPDVDAPSSGFSISKALKFLK